MLSTPTCVFCFSQARSGLSVRGTARVVQPPGHGSEDQAQLPGSAWHLSVLAADPRLAPGRLHQEFVQYFCAGEARRSEMLTPNFAAVLESFHDT